MRKEAGEELDKDKALDMEREGNEKECDGSKEDEENCDIFFPWGGSTMTTTMMTTTKSVILWQLS